MKIILAVFILVHGFAHLVGFVVPWQISKIDEMPYKTTILGGVMDVGDIGIRIFGIFWLLFVLAFFTASGLLLLKVSFWDIYTIIISILSLLLCIIGWPDSKIGVFVNIFIIAFIVMAGKTGWLS